MTDCNARTPPRNNPNLFHFPYRAFDQYRSSGEIFIAGYRLTSVTEAGVALTEAKRRRTKARRTTFKSAKERDTPRSVGCSECIHTLLP
jgi:hypothetical protein